MMISPYLRIHTKGFDARELQNYEAVGEASVVREILDRHNVRVESLFTGKEIESLRDEFQDSAQHCNKIMAVLAMPEGITPKEYEAIVTELAHCRHVEIMMTQNVRGITLSADMYRNDAPKPTDW